MKKIFLIDNYDSFTYNLSHYLEELGCKVVTKRNDMFDINEIKEYDGILISPGPGIPDEAGMTKEVIKKYFIDYHTKSQFCKFSSSFIIKIQK